MAISESQKKAVRKYNAKAYDRLEITVAKGRKAELQAHAQGRGESLNAFVNRAIDGQIRNDKRRKPGEWKDDPIFKGLVDGSGKGGGDA
ncbi:MAG: hypothetical protein LBI54_06635 [Lachnospiraceae bacterium]|jgi:hypothetical protein|nr:hypothetical protein [Lachnospiraceae bacterium]